VKWFDNDKGIGFITRDDGGDASVGYGNIVSEPAELRTGQRVRVDREDGRNGTWALNVSVTGSGPVTPTVTAGPATGLSGVVKSFDAAKGLGSIVRVDGCGYATSSAERDSAVSVHGYHSEGVACHVLQNQQAGSTALYRLFHT